MQRKLKWLFVIGIVGVAALGSTVLATPPQGASFVQLAPVAQFAEIDDYAKSGDWKSKIDMKGLSDLHVTEITIQPGGNGGWHSHPGPSFIIVKSGTMKFYEGNDPTCTPREIATGSSLFEPADFVHIPRNEGSVPLVIVVAQLTPTGAPRRIDEPSSGNCPF